MPEIASKRLGPIHDDVKGGCRVGDSRALAIHKSGTFHDFRDGFTGRGAIELIMHLDKCDQAAAVKVAKAWLSDHAGQGRLQPVANEGVDEEAAEDDVAQTAMIKGIWERAQPIKGTPAEKYLKSRGLTPAEGDMEQLRWLPNMRGDEGAMLAAITDKVGNLVATRRHISPMPGTNPRILRYAKPYVGRTIGTHGLRSVRQSEGQEGPHLRRCRGCPVHRAAGAEYAVALTGIAQTATHRHTRRYRGDCHCPRRRCPGLPADDALWRGIVAVMGKTDSRTV